MLPMFMITLIEIKFFFKVKTYKTFVMFISPKSIFIVEVPTSWILLFFPPIVLMFLFVENPSFNKGVGEQQI